MNSVSCFRRVPTIRFDGLAAEEAGEAGFEGFVGKELLGGRGIAGWVVVGFAVEQELGGIGEHLGGRSTGVDGDELDAGALVVSEIDIHGVKAMLWGVGSVNRTLVTRRVTGTD